MQQADENRATVTGLAERPSGLSRRWPVLALAAGLTALTLVVFTARVDASGQTAVAGPPAIVLQAESAENISGSDLAVAIFIPSVFVAATGLLLLWAYMSREKDGDQR